MESAANLEVAAVGSDVAGAKRVAASVGGRFLVDERDDALPFRTLVTAVTDDLHQLEPAAGVGAYVVCRRTMLPREPRERPTGQPSEGVIGVYPLVHHPDLSHGEADAHWRDVHAPLALVHHTMTHYEQLSIVQRIHGPEWDGFALCGMASAEDLRHRFYSTDESRQTIARDVATFADTASSPRRVIAVETRFA